MTTAIAWSRRAADELWSGVVTPLTFSVLAEQMAEHMVRRRLRQAGLVPVSLQPVFRLVRGHVYVNASLIHDVMQEVPSLFLSDGVLALLPEALRSDLAGRPRALYDPRTLATVARLAWNERGWAPWSRARLFREEAARVASELGGFEVPAGATDEEIAARLASVRERLGRFLDVVSWAMIYAYVFFHLAAHLTREWLPDEEPLSLLATGISGIRTFEVHDEMSALAARVRHEPALRSAVLGGAASGVVDAAARGELGAFGEGLGRIRDRHGHRLVARDLAFATWGEKPEAIVEMIRRLAGSDAPPVREDPAVALARARAKIARGTLGGLRSRLFDAGRDWCQEYYAVRENMRYHADYFLAALRALALEAARRLAGAGALRAEEDVFYLTIDELDGALRRPEPAADLGSVATRRRDEYSGYGDASPPEVVWEGPDGEISDRAAAESRSGPPPTGELRATPASPGIAQGTVRVVRTVEELDLVKPGDVIVATATDPTWTSYLSLASGLVLEVGGLLSHGAIIARELGIPAVVDLANATTALPPGQKVRVDGSKGVVERI